jgi:protein disulfide-isomerase
MRITFSEHPFLTIGCILGLTLGCASWFRGRFRRRGGHFRLDDPVKELKQPLIGGLGANGGPKVD